MRIAFRAGMTPRNLVAAVEAAVEDHVSARPEASDSRAGIRRFWLPHALRDVGDDVLTESLLNLLKRAVLRPWRPGSHRTDVLDPERARDESEAQWTARLERIAADDALVFLRKR
jgi:hypothetical protein